MSMTAIKRTTVSVPEDTWRRLNDRRRDPGATICGEVAGALDDSASYRRLLAFMADCRAYSDGAGIPDAVAAIDYILENYQTVKTGKRRGG